MIKITCPVCDGKGRIPISHSGPMGYYDPKTGDSFPHETCPGCNGSRVQEQ